MRQASRYWLFSRLLLMCLRVLPGTISGGTMKEIQETTTKSPLGRYVCNKTGVRRRTSFIWKVDGFLQYTSGWGEEVQRTHFESRLRIISIGPYNSAVFFVQGHDIDFVLLSSLVHSIMAKSTIKPDLRCIVYVTSHLELTFLQHQTMRFSLQSKYMWKCNKEEKSSFLAFVMGKVSSHHCLLFLLGCRLRE